MNLKMELLNICTNTMYFLSEDKFYQATKGMANGSSIFMEHSA
jgi:hypothetical protein